MTSVCVPGPEVPTKGLPPPGVVITIGGASGDGSDGDQSAEGNDGIQIASPPPPTTCSRPGSTHLNLEHTSCGMPDKVSHSINRRITWRGVNNTIVGTGQRAVDRRVHGSRRRGFTYRHPQPVQRHRLWHSRPHEELRSRPRHPTQQLEHEVHSGQTVPVGNPSNMAINLEATTHSPPTTAPSCTRSTSTPTPTARAPTSSMATRPTTRGASRVQHRGRDEQDRVQDVQGDLRDHRFPLLRRRDAPGSLARAHLLLDTSSPMSFSGGDGGHNAFAEGASFTLPVDIDCNAVPRPSECPFIRLADEVDIYWDLAITASGGSVLGSSSSRVPIRASVPSGTNNPVTQAFGRGCTNQFEQPVGCPANSTDNMTTAFTTGLSTATRRSHAAAVTCTSPSSLKGRPPGLGSDAEGRGLAKPYVEGRDPLGGFIIPFLDGLPSGPSSASPSARWLGSS